jgi:hypothetical protein
VAGGASGLGLPGEAAVLGRTRAEGAGLLAGLRAGHAETTLVAHNLVLMAANAKGPARNGKGPRGTYVLGSPSLLGAAGGLISLSTPQRLRAGSEFAAGPGGCDTDRRCILLCQTHEGPTAGLSAEEWDSAFGRALRLWLRCERAGQLCILHCSHGDHRSASLAAAFLYALGMPRGAAYDSVHAARRTSDVTGHKQVAERGSKALRWNQVRVPMMDAARRWRRVRRAFVRWHRVTHPAAAVDECAAAAAAALAAAREGSRLAGRAHADMRGLAWRVVLVGEQKERKACGGNRPVQPALCAFLAQFVQANALALTRHPALWRGAAPGAAEIEMTVGDAHRHGIEVTVGDAHRQKRTAECTTGGKPTRDNLVGVIVQADFGQLLDGTARAEIDKLGERPLAAMYTMCPGAEAIDIGTPEDFEKHRGRHLLHSRTWNKATLKFMTPLLPSRALPRGVVFLSPHTHLASADAERTRIEAAQRAFAAGHAVLAGAQGGPTVLYLPVLRSASW